MPEDRAFEERGFVYAFTVVADTGFDFREALKLQEVRWAYERLSEAFELGSLCYRPDTELARREVEESWPHPAPIPICSGAGRQWETPISFCYN